ncbi:MAG: hypothetical protein QS748_07930 [Candidatus Endonucleobacter bathymodioli]|uniref:Transposase InsH N-terminal domain-containing protein n=1 Tax=Candidatus Endonucleibacter bathymodioli TaxID=539814 RepID=A0AA90NTM8_9GAMM|nr:hypothetical protein [Candidatus Endonucleobacter bathymodioli]
MSPQLSSTENSFVNKRQKLHKEELRAEIEKLVSCHRITTVIDPFYSKQKWQTTSSSESMIRTNFLQQLYSLSDKVLEDALYGIA